MPSLYSHTWPTCYAEWAFGKRKVALEKRKVALGKRKEALEETWRRHSGNTKWHLRDKIIGSALSHPISDEPHNVWHDSQHQLDNTQEPHGTHEIG